MPPPRMMLVYPAASGSHPMVKAQINLEPSSRLETHCSCRQKASGRRAGGPARQAGRAGRRAGRAGGQRRASHKLHAHHCRSAAAYTSSVANCTCSTDTWAPAAELRHVQYRYLGTCSRAAALAHLAAACAARFVMLWPSVPAKSRASGRGCTHHRSSSCMPLPADATHRAAH